MGDKEDADLLAAIAEGQAEEDISHEDEDPKEEPVRLPERRDAAPLEEES